jgi:excisionase family DNA binding protein
MMGPHAFSIGEAALILGLSEKSVRRLVGRGQIPGRLVGGVYRIPRAGICHEFGCDPPSICSVGGGRTCDLVRKVAS